MSNIKYHFTDTEIKKLVDKHLTIIYDTREQVNSHVLEYFKSKGIPFKRQKINEGDYTGIIKAVPEMGITRDLYFPIGIERKNGIEELAGNLAEKTDTRDDIRLERELMRAKSKGIDIYLIVEDANGLEKIRDGKYNSMYSVNAFIGKLSSIQTNYLKGTTWCSKKDTGYHIHRLLYYAVRNFLKTSDLTEDVKPGCFVPNDDLYPLCKGNGCPYCSTCNLYENLSNDGGIE